MSVQIIVLEWVNAILGISLLNLSCPWRSRETRFSRFHWNWILFRTIFNLSSILLHQDTLEICSMKQSCLLNIDLIDLFHHFCLFALFGHFIADLDQISSILHLWDHWDDLLSYEQSIAQENPIDPKVDSRQTLDRSSPRLIFNRWNRTDQCRELRERGIKRSEVVVHSLDQRWLNAEDGSGTVDHRLRENLFNL